MMPTLTIQPTTPEHAQQIAGCLDFATLETERLLGTDPMASLIDSRTVWYGDVPLCSFDIVKPTENHSASAWLMMTNHVKEQGVQRQFILTLGRTLSEAVKEYGRVEGAAWLRGGAPRMLQCVGAYFTLSAHPSFICWSLTDNRKLRRFA